MPRDVLDRDMLLGRLDPITYKKESDKDSNDLEQLDIPDSLIVLAELRPEPEWNLCRSVAKHLLGSIPEPDDVDIDED